MNVNIPSRQNIFREMRDYLMIALGMIMYGIGWTVFLLPNDITTGGVPGIASLVYFATGLLVQYVYFGINFLLLLLAIRILGWKFSIKTIFAVFTLTFFLPVIQQLTDGVRLLHDQPSWPASSAHPSAEVVSALLSPQTEARAERILSPLSSINTGISHWDG